MKKLATFVFALLLASSLSFAQTGGSTAPAQTDTKTDGKKAHKGGKKGHKGGKKSKKGDKGADATAAPK